MNKIKAVFFDLDGTLVDSNKYFWKANFKILKKLKIKFNKGKMIEEYTRKSYGLTRILQEKNFSDKRIKVIKRQRDKYYRNLLREKTKLREGIKETLKILQKNKIDLYVVTMNSFLNTSIILRKLKIKKYFKKIISRELIEESKQKPDPQIYLEALKRANINKSNILVIEDTIKGVIAANKAGLKCIFMPFFNMGNISHKQGFYIAKSENLTRFIKNTILKSNEQSKKELPI